MTRLNCHDFISSIYTCKAHMMLIHHRVFNEIQSIDDNNFKFRESVSIVIAVTGD